MIDNGDVYHQNIKQNGIYFGWNRKMNDYMR